MSQCLSAWQWSPCGWSCCHHSWPVVSPWVATLSLWAALVFLQVVVLLLQAASGVPVGGHGMAMAARSASRLPRQSHPSPAPRCHHPTGAGVPTLPLCPQPHCSGGTGHPLALRPQPHGCLLPALSQGLKESDFGGCFVLCHKAWLPMGDTRGRGAVPHAPHSPFSPCRAQGPSSASAWQGAWPPVPTCPRRTPAPSATPLSTGKGAAGTGLSPGCPLTPQGWPVVVTVAGHSVPVGGRDVPVCGCVGTMGGQRCPCGWPVSLCVASGVTMGGHYGGHPPPWGLGPQPYVHAMDAAWGGSGCPQLPLWAAEKWPCGYGGLQEAISLCHCPPEPCS